LRRERAQVCSKHLRPERNKASHADQADARSTAVAYKQRKCIDSRTDTASQSLAISNADRPHGLPTEFAALPSRPHLLASERFHALFRSLFKVLFNFPSRYLFAIGLVVIFSLRWSLPPTSPCTRKQGDSPKVYTGISCSRYGPCTLHGMEPHSGELTQASHTSKDLLHATVPVTVASNRIRRWAVPLSLAVTMGIPVGFFSSA